MEDNPDTAFAMTKLLMKLGHEVGMVHEEPSVIQAARQRRFDFILLDIKLPGLSGYEIATELRKDGCCKNSVIIAVSGYGQEENPRRSHEAGINHHFVKPIERNALSSLLLLSH